MEPLKQNKNYIHPELTNWAAMLTANIGNLVMGLLKLFLCIVEPSVDKTVFCDRVALIFECIDEILSIGRVV